MKKIVFLMGCIALSACFPPQNEIYFTPGPECENSIVSYIDSADNIDIVMYSLNNDVIVAALKRAQDRGAKIRILADKTQAATKNSKVLELYRYGIPVRVHTVYKIEHNKVGIFDGKVVVTGSFNWTNAATRRNSENCLISKQAHDAQTFQSRFNWLWQKNTAEKSDTWIERRQK